jgi:N-dimethylarginine dimethylaminohydrolase
MVAPLRQVLVKPPSRAFGSAFDDRAHGFRHPVDLAVAQQEHREFVALLERLGVEVHAIDDDRSGPDLVYAYDPALVTDAGAVLLRSGKPTRRGEESVLGEWFESHGIPVVGRVSEPGTVDGGDVFWLDGDTVCMGRSLRTNQAGLDQLASMLSGTIHVFDVGYDAGPDECLHLLSVISPVADRVAVVELPRLPAGLFRLLEDRGTTLIAVPPEEVESLACNVLAVRPGVVVMLDGNPVTRKRLEGAGIEVHVFTGDEICRNGSGGPTCLTRPVLRR